jgi:hypothetical protein
MSRATLNEGEILAALRKRYAAPEYALLQQVRNGVGFERTTRTADAVAMSVWPSRGLLIHGFEIKVSRSDWLREKKTPDKAEEISRFCDRWWLVVGDETIVQDGELPASWGLMVPRGRALVVKVDAPEREALAPSKLFLAAILRNAAASADSISRKQIDAELHEQAERLRKSHDEQRAQDRRSAGMELAEFKTAVKQFEEASGVTISRWHGGRIGEAVRLVMEGGVEAYERRLNDVRRICTEIVGRIETHAKERAERTEAAE